MVFLGLSAQCSRQVRVSHADRCGAEALRNENEKMSIGRTPNGTDIAGWILKGDPKVFDLDAGLDSGRVVERWSVHDTYRKDLMEDDPTGL
jgi:hypothetical protein